MSLEAQSWLPDAALLDGALERELQRLVGGWSRHWLQDDPAVETSVRLAPAPAAEADALAYADAQRDCVLFATPQGEVAIALAMLGLRVRWLRLKAGDLAVLRVFASAALGDLAARLAPSLLEAPLAPASLAAPARAEATAQEPVLAGFVHFALRWKGVRDGLHLALSRASAVRARRRLCRNVRPVRPPEPRASAVLAHTVRVGAYLGAGSVELSELCSLRVGDVLVLDQALDAPFELTVDGARTGQACVLREAAVIAGASAPNEARVA